MKRVFLATVNESNSETYWQRQRVSAETVEVSESGALIFCNNRFITKAFAAGHWRDVEVEQ